MTWSIKDTDVWSNAAYFPVGFAAAGIDPFAAGIVIAAGGVLAISSAAFHVNEDVRKLQRLDVTAAFGFLAATVAALLMPFVPDWPALIVPLVWAAYYRWKWEISTTRHFAVWAVLILTLTAYHAGVWALLPAALGAGAVTVQRLSAPDSHAHALWHVLSAAAVASALWVA
jgi:hypothetical protein